MDGVPLINPLAANIALSLTDARVALRASPSVVFNPDSLFGAGDGGGVIVANEPGVCLFQDAAGTVPVTAPGQSVLSVRARNRPAFLMVWRASSLPVTYELDPQGFPALRADLGDNTGWAYFDKEDGGLPVDTYSVVLTAMGAYGPNRVGVGTGWTVVGDAGGTETPYSYVGVYTVTAGDAAEASVNIDYLSPPQEFPVVENLDDRPYVLSSRIADNDSKIQVNLEPVYGDAAEVVEYSVPVGVRFWISPGDYWYGGVFITRYLNDTENLQTQIWCGGLAGITLTPVEAFDPLDLFLPGDVGGFYNPNDISTLFQTRTGPTVPVTADGQPVQFIVDQNGQFNLSRGLANNGFIYADGLLELTKSDTLNTQLTSATINGFEQATIVVGGWIDPASLGGALSFVVWASTVGPSTLNGGMQLSLDSRATPRLDMTTYVGGVMQPTSNNIPVEELASSLVIGARLDSSLSAQEVFCNDLEFVAAVTYEGMNGSSNFALVGSGTIASPAIGGTGPAFFINRWLSDTELAQLKAWMRANTQAA